MGVMKGSKIKEHVCPACNGTGYPVVMQPVQPGRKIYPLKCKVCDGKGKITSILTTAEKENDRRLPHRCKLGLAQLSGLKEKGNDRR
jgi:cytochrome c5